VYPKNRRESAFVGFILQTQGRKGELLLKSKNTGFFCGTKESCFIQGKGEITSRVPSLWGSRGRKKFPKTTARGDLLGREGIPESKGSEWTKTVL